MGNLHAEASLLGVVAPVSVLKTRLPNEVALGWKSRYPYSVVAQPDWVIEHDTYLPRGMHMHYLEASTLHNNLSTLIPSNSGVIPRGDVN